MTPEYLMIPGAPTPVAPFSHCVRVGPWVFITGQMPTFPEDDSAPLPEGVQAQTRQVMSNLAIVLAGVGLTLGDVVQARVYLTEFQRDYADMNAIWPGFFPAGKLPARTCVGTTGLARDALVEVDLIAFKDE